MFLVTRRGIEPRTPCLKGRIKAFICIAISKSDTKFDTLEELRESVKRIMNE